MTTNNDNNKEKKILNAPALRFPEFEGEWEKCKFRDVCKIGTGNKNTQDKVEDGIYPFFVRSQNVERINSWTFDGEAILTAGDGVGVGKIFHYSVGKIGVHQRVYILSDFECNGKYLYYYFSSHFYDRVKRMSAKNSVDSVRMEMIAGMPLSLPSSEEQIKIGKLLSLLDERISTQIRVIEKLESLMGGLFHTLTSSGNPNIKIQDCLYCSSSTLQESDVKEQGRYPVYGANGVIGFRDEYTEMDNAILVIKDGASVGNIRYTSGRYSFIGTLNCLKSKSDFSLRYLYYSLKSFNFKTYITGMAIPHIYFKDYGKAMIYCPSLPEQRRIAEILTAIDEKIQNENAILESYRTEKQYLLRQMFA